MNLKRILRALGGAILDEVERNPEFAGRIERAIAETAGSSSTASQSKEGTGKKKAREAAVIDPIALFAEQGEEGLRRALGALRLEQLLDVAAEFGMDSAKLVMKWKTPGSRH